MKKTSPKRLIKIAAITIGVVIIVLVLGWIVIEILDGPPMIVDPL